MMHKHFIAGITALALGIAGLTAAPVQAGNETAKIITGVAALAIIGTAIANSRDHDRRAISRNRGYSKQRYSRQGYSYGYDNYSRPNRYRFGSRRYRGHGGYGGYGGHRRGYNRH